MVGATVEIGEQGVNETEHLTGSAFRPVLVSSGDAQEHSGSMKRSRGANASALS